MRVHIRYILTPAGHKALEQALNTAWNSLPVERLRLFGNAQEPTSPSAKQYWLGLKDHTFRQLINDKGVKLEIIRSVCAQIAETLNIKPSKAWMKQLHADTPISPPQNTIERKAEIEAIQSKWKASPHLTLLGEGGIGKTWLANQLSRQVKPEPLWLSLIEVKSEENLLPTLATELGISFKSRQQLLEHIGTNHPALILDNCEHIAEACRDLLHDLTTLSPKIRVLATSRVALDYENEGVYRLEGLNEEEAYRFFLIVVKRTRPTFEPTAEERQSIQSLCDLLGGLPLAIEIVASHHFAHSFASLLSALKESAGLYLENHGENSQSNHISLNETLQWSYELLTREEKSLFTRIALFQAGCDMKALEEIVALEPLQRPQIANLLTKLVKKSLLRYDRATERYSMLEPVRQFANTLLEQAPERESLLQRYAGYYLRHLEDNKHRLQNEEQKICLQEWDLEQPNIYLAIQRANTEDKQRFCYALKDYWILQGGLVQALPLVQSCLEGEAQNLNWARGVLSWAFILSRLGTTVRGTEGQKQAQELISMALPHFNPEVHLRECGEAYFLMGWIHFRRREYLEALQTARKSCEFYAKARYDHGQGKALQTLASAIARQPQNPPRLCHEEVLPLYEQALSLLERSGDMSEVALVHCSFALFYKDWVEEQEIVGISETEKWEILDKGHSNMNLALERSSKSADTRSRGYILHQAAIYEVKWNNLVVAQGYWREAIPLQERSGDISMALEATYWLCLIFVHERGERIDRDLPQETLRELMVVWHFVKHQKKVADIRWRDSAEETFEEIGEDIENYLRARRVQDSLWCEIQEESRSLRLLEGLQRACRLDIAPYLKPATEKAPSQVP